MKNNMKSTKAAKNAKQVKTVKKVETKKPVAKPVTKIAEVKKPEAKAPETKVESIKVPEVKPVAKALTPEEKRAKRNAYAREYYAKNRELLCKRSCEWHRNHRKAKAAAMLAIVKPVAEVKKPETVKPEVKKPAAQKPVKKAAKKITK